MENTLSQYLKQVRSERNLSLRELEILTGVSYSYLSVIERGCDARVRNHFLLPSKSLSKSLKALIYHWGYF